MAVENAATAFCPQGYPGSLCGLGDRCVLVGGASNRFACDFHFDFFGGSGSAVPSQSRGRTLCVVSVLRDAAVAGIPGGGDPVHQLAGRAFKSDSKGPVSQQDYSFIHLYFTDRAPVGGNRSIISSDPDCGSSY